MTGGFKMTVLEEGLGMEMERWVREQSVSDDDGIIKL
jgi:hypothetical protein